MNEERKLITAVIDEKEVRVPRGSTILEAAASVGIDIPVFCYHPKLSIDGNCRMCLVEIEGGKKPVTACSTELAEGAVVHTNTPSVLEARSEIMEDLLINHPLDCPVCDKGGECLLQDHAYDWGPGASRFTEKKRLFKKPIPLSDRILLDRERCILCTRCVRFCEEISDHHQLTIVETGGGSYIDVAPDTAFESQFSNNTTDICPVGALTSVSFRFKARPWEMQSTPGICPFCGCGCNIVIQTRSRNILRFMVRENPEADAGWLCDRGRYGFVIANRPDRIKTPLVRRQGRLIETSWDEALKTAVERLRLVLSQYGPNAVGGIGSEWGTVEENALLQRLVREGLGSQNVDCTLSANGRPAALAISEGLGAFRLSDIEQAGSILMMGADPSRHQPIIDLRLKKAVRSRGVRLLMIHAHDTEMMKYAAVSMQNRTGSEEQLLRLLTAAVKKETSYENHDADLKETGVSRDAIETAVSLYREGQKNLCLIDASLFIDGVRVYLVKELLNAMGPDTTPGMLFDSANGYGARTAGSVPGFLPGLQTTERGLAGNEMITAAERSTLKALYILGTEHHDAETIVRARRGAELMICHSMILNEAAACADIVFPAAAFSEKKGTIVNTAGLNQECNAAMPPPGGVRTEGEVLRDMMNRLKA